MKKFSTLANFLLFFSFLLTIPGAVCAETVSLEATSHTVDQYVRAVKVTALWGTIRVEAGTGDQVQIEMSAKGDARSESAREQGPVDGRVWIDVIESEGVLEVVPRSDLEGFWSIDLRITVPERLGVELVMERGGEISVDGVAGTVDIVNWNGSIEGTGLKGAALVHARNGSIELGFDEVPRSAPMSFSSLNGSVDVTLPSSVQASIRGRTANGTLESDFGAVKQGFEPGETELTQKAPRTFSAQLNGGGPNFSFYSANGSIYLRRQNLAAGP